MKYNYLRGALRQVGIDQKELARMWNVAQPTISHRFSGRTPWTLDEMYCLLDLCGAAEDQMHLYFPRDGIDKPRERMTLIGNKNKALA